MKFDDIKKKIIEVSSGLSGTALAFISQTELLKNIEKITSSAATVYDKALDMEYLKTHVGGGDHRLFDGGHDIFSAWDRAKDAMPDDSFQQEVLGYVSALWKDVTTTKGLPFTTVSKESFDSWVDSAVTWIPGVDRKYLYDLMSFDAMELLSSVLGALGIIFAIKKEDQEKLAELLGSMGIISIMSANPIMGLLVVATTGYAYTKKKMELDKKSLIKGLSATAVSMALFSVLGLPILFELVIVAVLTNIFKKQIFENEHFNAIIRQKIIEQSKSKSSEIIAFIKNLYSETRKTA